ncbi:MAG: rhodanese-like domain-containing protein [Candidatus Krumholzibacteriales bacterium]
MKILKIAIVQSVIIAAIALVLAFSYNSVSESGIDPFRDRSGREDVNRKYREGDFGVEIIDMERMLKILDRGAILIDARTEEAYNKGHIPGAILFDYYMFSKYIDMVLPQLDPTRNTVIYCSSPSCGIAEQLARELYSLGYENLHVFKGGFSTWEERGRPVERGIE